MFVKEESIRCLVEIHDLLSCNVILLTMKLTTLKESVTELLKVSGQPTDLSSETLNVNFHSSLRKKESLERSFSSRFKMG